METKIIIYIYYAINLPMITYENFGWGISLNQNFHIFKIFILINKIKFECTGGSL